MSGRVVQGEGEPRYTSREREVMHLLARGLSLREIAQHLYISTSTARNHVANIRRKGGFGGRGGS